MNHEDVPAFVARVPLASEAEVHRWIMDAVDAMRAEHARLAYIIAHGRYGITERGEAVVYLPGLVPAPAHVGGLLEAIDAAIKEQTA